MFVLWHNLLDESPMWFQNNNDSTAFDLRRLFGIDLRRSSVSIIPDNIEFNSIETSCFDNLINGPEQFKLRGGVALQHLPFEVHIKI